jgi:hypothetical protein
MRPFRPAISRRAAFSSTVSSSERLLARSLASSACRKGDKRMIRHHMLGVRGGCVVPNSGYTPYAAPYFAPTRSPYPHHPDGDAVQP